MNVEALQRIQHEPRTEMFSTLAVVRNLHDIRPLTAIWGSSIEYTGAGLLRGPGPPTLDLDYCGFLRYHLLRLRVIVASYAFFLNYGFPQPLRHGGVEHIWQQLHSTTFSTSRRANSRFM